MISERSVSLIAKKGFLTQLMQVTPSFMDKHIIGKLNESVRLGKLSLGVDFALEKVLAMTSMPPEQSYRHGTGNLGESQAQKHQPAVVSE